MKAPQGAGGLFRRVMCVLPRDLRRRRGEEMEQAFGVLRERARAAGRFALIALYVREIADLVRVGVTLRLRAWHVAREARTTRTRRSSVLRDDMRLAFRSVTRHAGFFAVAAGTLALGIGATTVTFSALKSVVLDGLPYPGSDRLVLVWRTVSGAGMRLTPDASQTEALLTDRSVFEDVATYSGGQVIMTTTGGAGPAKLNTIMMGSSLAGFLDLRPLLGRLFSADEYAGEGAHVMLLSHAMWRGQFGGSADVLGSALTLDGEPWTVIGVMPPGLVRPDGLPTPIDAWVPLPATSKFAQPIARLRAGVTLEAASKLVDSVVRTTSQSDGYGGVVLKATAMRSTRLRDPLRVLMIAVAMLLLIACVNVSNLLLHRASTRNRETAVLAALGASRPRLIRQFMMESLLLAFAGGAAGTGLAALGVRLIIAMRPAELEVLNVVRLDGGVLLFAVAASAFAGILFGLVPALRGARVDAGATLSRAAREGDSGSTRFRWSLVALEVALSFALLVGASIVIGTLREYAARDPGYEPDGLLDVAVTLPGWSYTSAPTRRTTFDRIVEVAARVPGVDAISLAQGAPPRVGLYFGRIQVEGEPAMEEATRLHGSTIDARYLDVIGQRLVAGRNFNEAELAGEVRAVMIGETTADRLFPGVDALGRRFSMGGGDMFTVVGIVRDAALTGLSESEPVPIAYWPMTETYAAAHVLARVHGALAETGSALRAAVRSVEPDAMIQITPATDLLGQTLARERFTTSLLTVFALLALLLSAIGLYSVLSSVVSRRTHEIGIRVSLGADAARIRRLVLRSGLFAIGAGIGAGAALLAGGLRILGSQVFGVTASRPAAWLVAAIVLSAISLMALWLPVERAARVDPMRAMRSDG